MCAHIIMHVFVCASISGYPQVCQNKFILGPNPIQGTSIHKGPQLAPRSTVKVPVFIQFSLARSSQLPRCYQGWIHESLQTIFGKPNGWTGA